MPARGQFHDNLKNALLKAGWNVTHDPYRLSWGGKDLYVDLGAVQLVTAEKDGKKIAIELKPFTGPTDVDDLHSALGQYLMYRSIMRRTDPDRQFYMAVRMLTFRDVFQEPLGLLVRADFQIALLVFDEQSEELSQWIESTTTDGLFGTS